MPSSSDSIISLEEKFEPMPTAAAPSSSQFCISFLSGIIPPVAMKCIDGNISFIILMNEGPPNNLAGNIFTSPVPLLKVIPVSLAVAESGNNNTFAVPAISPISGRHNGDI